MGDVIEATNIVASISPSVGIRSGYSDLRATGYGLWSSASSRGGERGSVIDARFGHVQDRLFA
jgi:hypothetical protein